MSRSGYSDDLGWSELNLYRANVDRALAGRRGQAFLREMLAAMDALPEKRLIAYYFHVKPEDVKEWGPKECGVCAIATVGLARGLDMSDLRPETEPYWVAKRFGIAKPMAAEIEYINDEANPSPETPEERFRRVRNWVVAQIESSEES